MLEPPDRLRIVVLRRGLAGYRIGDENADGPGISIAIVDAALDLPESTRAWGCDLLVVSRSASLVLTEEAIARLGHAGGDRLTSGSVLDGPTLLELRLAAFAIDPDVDATLRRIEALGGTIEGLVRIRRAPSRQAASAVDDFAVECEPALRTITLRLRNDPLPCFTIPLLERMEALFVLWRRDGIEADTLIFASETPAVFSLGGDLATIARLARRRDGVTLRHYAHLSVRVIHDLWAGLGRDIVTIGAVDGKAFGAGFEGLLACHATVAGPRASFALPEARFGLFPGMGATSLLARRLALGFAEEMILSGRALEVEEAQSLGLVDCLAETETAEACTRRVYAAQDEDAARRRHDLLQRRRGGGLYQLQEALAVVDVWVEAVLSLREDKIRDIERIARVQGRTIR